MLARSCGRLRGMAKGHRLESKKRNRELAGARWELVHWAGCTQKHTTAYGFACAGEGVLDPDWPEGLPSQVSVPRSLRPRLGRYLP